MSLEKTIYTLLACILWIDPRFCWVILILVECALEYVVDSFSDIWAYISNEQILIKLASNFTK